MTNDWRPPHAYVPGQTPRHDEHLFDAIKSGVEDCAVENLHHSQAWSYGIAFLEDGFYWEAHEVLEAVWMACPPNAPERLMVQAVIQLTNAKLKEAMGRDQAASRLFKTASRLSAEAVQRKGGNVMGLDSEIMN